ncbi:MAG: NIL domain-containing protein [Bacillota bacterium]|nr:NIL domain-containing protein [Bacillota bacterium]MDW7682971.1 NIL domain-containing protein [Bacillota bacterium]
MKRKLVLRFPASVVESPFIYSLAKDFNIVANILQANINPRKEGRMVVELSGEEADYEKGVEFLTSRGVMILPLEQQIVWVEERCTQCGACTVICPTNALWMKRPEMTVAFCGEKCVACEHCLKACPARAVEARYLAGV